jgi:hypothetical protein
MAEPDFSGLEFTRQMSDGRSRIVRLAMRAAWSKSDYISSKWCLTYMRDAIAAEIALMEGEA